MSGFIPKDDVIDPILQKLLKELAGDVANITKEFKKLVEESKNLNASQGLKDIIEQSKKAVDADAQLAKVKKELADVTAKLAVAYSNENIALANAKEIQKKVNADISESITGKKKLAQTEAELKKQQSDRAALESQRSKAFVKQKQDEELAFKKRSEAEKKFDQEQSKYWENRRKESVSNLTASNPQLKSMGSYYKGLEQQSDKQITKDLNDRKAATKLLAQEEKLKIAIEAQSVGSIKRLQAENALSAFTIKNKLNPAIAAERAEILRLNQTIGTNKTSIADMQRKQVTAWGRITQAVVQHLAAYVGFQQVINVIKSIFNQTRELDALSFSFKTIIKDQQELAQTQEFLAKTADAFGLSLINLSERYMRFRAASLQSNMTALDTQKIFYSFGKAAAVLGLKTDEVSGVFLALEQMISKGKITTEELRRQLGERLSGAFGIFAKALGVTTSELDKMLKAGKVLTVDVLIPASEQLEKSYGTENVTRVDNLTAAQGRLNTAWTLFIKALDSAGVFRSLLNAMIIPTKGLTDAINGVDGEFIKARASAEMFADDLVASAERAGDQARFDAIKKGVNSVTATKIQNAAVVSELEKSLLQQQESATKKSEELRKKDADGYAFLTKLVNENRGDLLTQFNLIDDAYIKTAKNAESLSSGRVILPEGTGIIMEVNKKFIKDLILQSKAIENVKQKLKELKNVSASSGESTDTETPKDTFTKLEKLKEANKQQLESEKQFLEEYNEYFKGSEIEKVEIEKENAIHLLEVRKNQIDEELKLVKFGSEEYAKLLTERAKTETSILSKTNDFNDKLQDLRIKRQKEIDQQFEDDVRSANDAFIANQTSKADNKKLDIQKKALDDLRANPQDQEKIHDKMAQDMIKADIDMYQTIADNATSFAEDDIKLKEWALAQQLALKIQYGNLEFDVDKRNADKIKEEKIQTLQKVGELLNEGFNFSQQIYSNQADAAKRRYDDETQAAGDNLEAKTIAERKYDEELKKIKKRQAIAEKAQALFSIGLNTAIAVMSYTGKGAVWMVPLIISLGAIQAAAVMSKSIPEYFKGTDNAPETFIAGDTQDGKGASELIVTKSGKSILTPDKPTLFSDPLFKGAKIYPNLHGKTQRMLNNYATAGGGQIFLDMSDTNSHLKTIAQNTKNSEIRGIDSRGRSFVKRGAVTTHLN